MSVVKKFLVLCLVIVASAKVWGQASSPFTTFGIGEPYGNALIHNQGMGGTGVSQPQFWYLNNQNPALLVFNTLTVFEAGLLAENRTLRGDGSAKEKHSGGNMSYLATAFPVKLNRWTTAIGLMPYTNVKFNFVETRSINDLPYQQSSMGSGGLSQLYWSNGVRLTPDISIGLKSSYVFGAIEYTTSNLLNKSDQVPLRPNVTNKITGKDFNFGVGFSFSKDSLWGKNYRLSFGAMYELPNDLNAKRQDFAYTTNAAGDTLSKDNISHTYNKIKIPSSITVGVSIARGLKWSASTEFSYQDWSTFEDIAETGGTQNVSWRAALGGEITPDAFASNYLKRLTYRIGGSIEQLPFSMDGKTVKDRGVTFGLSLPAGRSNLNLAVKYGKRGDKAQNLFEENYVRVFFGITFNDQWFIKRKFD
jgi:hypothetical protein